MSGDYPAHAHTLVFATHVVPRSSKHLINVSIVTGPGGPCAVPGTKRCSQHVLLETLPAFPPVNVTAPRPPTTTTLQTPSPKRDLLRQMTRIFTTPSALLPVHDSADGGGRGEGLGRCLSINVLCRKRELERIAMENKTWVSRPYYPLDLATGVWVSLS